MVQPSARFAPDTYPHAVEAFPTPTPPKAKRRKLGAVLGDHCQLGCGSVTEPGCFLAPNTHAYPLSRLPRGVYGPRELLKSRPRMERAALR